MFFSWNVLNKTRTKIFAKKILIALLLYVYLFRQYIFSFFLGGGGGGWSLIKVFNIYESPLYKIGLRVGHLA